VRSYQARYPNLPPERFCLIENGYDEEEFARAKPTPGPSRQTTGRPFVLLHSGIVYPSERDPGPLFSALGRLKRDCVLTSDNFRLVLRAPVHDALLARLAHDHDIADLVEIVPPLPYGAALSEMLAADGLLVLQAANCNDQVPAKLYEYLRAGRPILALTDLAGDTAGLMRAAGIDSLAPLDDTDAIFGALAHFVKLAKDGRAPLAPPAFVAAQARRARTDQLAALLDEVAGVAGAATAAHGAKSSNAP
jgi:glycosyltransferase involved in cell wall biosynthesis